MNDNQIEKSRERRGVIIPNRIHTAHPNAFVLNVVGTSMEPGIHDGDVILVDPDLHPENGTVTAVLTPMVAGGPHRGSIIGRFYRTEKGAWLEKDNYAPVAVFLGRSYTVMGVVPWILERFNEEAQLPECVTIAVR